MTNYKNRLGYVLENKNIHVCGYTNDNKIIFQDNDIYNRVVGKQRKATLYTTKKGVYFNFKGKRNYVTYFIKEVETIDTDSTKEVEVKATNTESTETALSNMIGDVGSLIASLQTTNSNKTLGEINKQKYIPQSNFAKWLDNLVKSEIKKKVEEEHSEAISLLRKNDDLIGAVRNKVEQVFLKTFGAENLQCDKINVDKIFGESTVSKYSFLAKENGFNSNDVDRLVQTIIYGVLKDSNRI